MDADSPARTSSRNAGSTRSSVFSKANPRKLPTRGWREEVAVGCPAVTARRCAACALEHELAAHEFSIVFAHCTGRSGEAGVGKIGALRPFPHVAEDGS